MLKSTISGSGQRAGGHAGCQGGTADACFFLKIRVDVPVLEDEPELWGNCSIGGVPGSARFVQVCFELFGRGQERLVPKPEPFAVGRPVVTATLRPALVDRTQVFGVEVDAAAAYDEIPPPVPDGDVDRVVMELPLELADVEPRTRPVDGHREVVAAGRWTFNASLAPVFRLVRG